MRSLRGNGCYRRPLLFFLTNLKNYAIIPSQVCRAAAWYQAERYYREESPGITGQGS